MMDLQFELLIAIQIEFGNMRGFISFLQFGGATVWCWKDERTRGASQTRPACSDDYKAEKLVFNLLLE